MLKQIKAIKEGTWKSGSYWKGLEAEIVNLAPLTANAPTGAKEAVEKAKSNYTLRGKQNICRTYNGSKWKS